MRFPIYFTLLLPIILAATAQDGAQEKVWSAVVYTLYGDSTPFALPYSRTLTPLGAQQLFGAGSAFRDRYLDDGGEPGDTGTKIRGISPVKLLPDGMDIYSMTDQHVSASALAFMQGLYPPTIRLSNTTLDEAAVVNGTVMDFPLDGYQYPEIYTAGSLDPTSVQIAGHLGCDRHGIAEGDWTYTDKFNALLSQSSMFYSQLYNRVFHGVLAEHEMSFSNAYSIYEVLNYQYIHNSTVRNSVTQYELSHARSLANQYVFATNGRNTTLGTGEDEHILAVAGRTLAKHIDETFETNYRTNGAMKKLSLLFGSFEPMVAFSALSNLASDRQTNFYDLPDQGASMVFELFSFESDDSIEYPTTSTDMMVRFFLRNGTNVTDVATPLVSYPLFGRGPGQTGIPYDEFRQEMAKISMPVSDWCLSCGSSSVFCDAYLPLVHSPVGTGRSKLSPAVAGVIGAVIGLVAVGLILSAIALIFGFRVHRNVTPHKPDLGGFKGSDKLASDPDLTSGPKHGAAPAGISVNNAEPANSSARGHERIGSWEMNNTRVPTGSEAAPGDSRSAPHSLGRLSFESDDSAVSPIAEPVKVYERV
ncbi:hypothetical protein FQN52_002824 [Onygenales sp. PD_12]|nr:hypothetical protein FQN52_002824 [Onygenales sp. PD_12]